MTQTASVDDLRARIARAAQIAAAQGIDALLISPGPDLRYLIGYDALPLERLTCLVIPATGDPCLVAPALERAAALASPIGDLGIAVHTWGELDDPYALTAELVGAAATVSVDDLMHAVKVLRLRAAMPGSEQRAAGAVLRELRMRKSANEIAALVEAGAAIDTVHAAMDQWLRPGRTEREVGRDIADAILASGHSTVDFVIVGSGPNGSSPHHELSDRVIQPGDSVVVDIGGTMPTGYCSDSTRTYSLGEPAAAVTAYYEPLQVAQAAALAAVRPGITCEALDSVARDALTAAGWGEQFMHRTGHGIGLETHEDPYIVQGNSIVLEAGMAFSIEPGVYLAGEHGARIEDIVVCGEQGAIMCNNRPRELAVLAG